MYHNSWRTAADWYRNRTYCDEPITPRAQLPQEELPAPIQAMRNLEREVSSLSLSNEELFVRQARAMEDYEDDYPFTREVIRYYPTYRSLRDDELRGYFSWRSRVRKGLVQKTSLSFAFLYVYELLNQVGCSDAEDGFRKLRAFGAEYEILDEKISRYLRKWLWDYVVCYELDPTLLADRREVLYDQALQVLLQTDGRSEEEITLAAAALAGYRLDHSRFYRTRSAEMNTVTARVLKGIAEHYRKNCKKTWIEEYIGSMGKRSVLIFDSAVFWERDRSRVLDYDVDPVRHYHADRGRWYVNCCDYSRLAKHKLRDLLRTVDSLMRDACSFPHPIKPALSTRWILALIQEQISLHQEEAREAERRTLHLDLSRLGDIRKDADYTRDRLMADGEFDDDTEEELPADMEEEAVPPLCVESESSEALSCLSPQELRYLRSLLSGGDLSWVRAEGLLPSVLADSINEKLFDLFGDTVLDESGVVSDYTDDLKEMSEV
ncbi:MAG: TerB N-terminal domain-containing protein [Oscillospiraceae bacterium]|nr:TerB N-terminal domain-containing protein [Oscillospiraceae bacterium]